VHLPEFLHPVPAVVVPVSGKSLAYAQQVAQRLRDKGQKVEVDESDDKLGAKLRRCKLKGVPNVWVVGEKKPRRLRTGPPCRPLCPALARTACSSSDTLPAGQP